MLILTLMVAALLFGGLFPHLLGRWDGFLAGCDRTGTAEEPPAVTKAPLRRKSA